MSFVDDTGREDFADPNFPRSDKLLEKYFGESVVAIEGKRVKVHRARVADFIVHVAGGRARHGIRPGGQVRRDFEVVLRTNPL
jgi:hypothetical protein